MLLSLLSSMSFFVVDCAALAAVAVAVVGVYLCHCCCRLFPALVVASRLLRHWSLLLLLPWLYGVAVIFVVITLEVLLLVPSFLGVLLSAVVIAAVVCLFVVVLIVVIGVVAWGCCRFCCCRCCCRCC